MNYTVAKNTLNLPVIPLRGLVALPGVVLQFDVGRDKSVKAVDAVMQKNQLVFLTAQTEVYMTTRRWMSCTGSERLPGSSRC